MRLHLFNDNSRIHGGCAAVTQTLRELLEEHDILSTHTVNSYTFDQQFFQECDAVVINGEGSIHHSRPYSLFLLDVLSLAQKSIKKTFLVNTTWQAMTRDYDETLLSTDLVSVREIISQKELKEIHRVSASAFLDLSFFADINQFSDYTDFNGETAFGDFFITRDLDSKVFRDLPRCSLNQSWSRIVNSLRTARMYITGRHHGVYAACKARTPFVPYVHNTHKISGLLRWAGTEIPIACNSDEVLVIEKWALRNRSVYERLFDWMEMQPAPRWAGLNV